MRRIEDKQLGLWFLKAKDGVISENDIKFKLMHFLWDNVFAREKRPLHTLLGMNERELVTFGQFSDQSSEFIAQLVPTTAQETAAD